MWNTYRKFFQLPPESKRFVIRIPLILAMTYAGLELFGLKLLLARIQRLVPTAGRLAECGPQEIQTYTRLFSAVAQRCPLRLKCLGRSVSLCWLLRQQGIDATVHIGVRKENDGLDAHAWVQFGDFVIDDTKNVAERYTRVLPSYSRIDSCPLEQSRTDGLAGRL